MSTKFESFTSRGENKATTRALAFPPCRPLTMNDNDVDAHTYTPPLLGLPHLSVDPRAAPRPVNFFRREPYVLGAALGVREDAPPCRLDERRLIEGLFLREWRDKVSAIGWVGRCVKTQGNERGLED